MDPLLLILLMIPFAIAAPLAGAGLAAVLDRLTRPQLYRSNKQG